MSELLKLIGWKLIQHRKQRNVTQRTIASDAKIPLSTYVDMENANRLYRIDALLKVLCVYELDPIRALESSNHKPIRLVHPEHEILHDKLQQLLEAQEPWPTTARINVEAVYLKFEKGEA